MTARPVTLRRLDHVVLRVRDLDDALRFYRDVLGCQLEKVQADLGLYQLRAGDSLIDLVTLDGRLGRQYARGPDRAGPNVDHFCLQVDPWDAAAIAAWLAEHGIAAGDVSRRYGALGYGPSIYIEDPDGNTVELKGPPENPAGQ